MDCVLAGMQWYTCLVRLHDILLGSDSRQMLEGQVQVLAWLCGANLKHNNLKVTFSVTFSYLSGHIVSVYWPGFLPPICEGLCDRDQAQAPCTLPEIHYVNCTNCTNLESGVFQSMCKVLGIKTTCSSPFRPQSDGQVEGVNANLQKMLATTTGIGT